MDRPIPKIVGNESAPEERSHKRLSLDTEDEVKLENELFSQHMKWKGILIIYLFHQKNKEIPLVTINTWAILVVAYSFGIIKWSNTKLQEMVGI